MSKEEYDYANDLDKKLVGKDVENKKVILLREIAIQLEAIASILDQSEL